MKNIPEGMSPESAPSKGSSGSPRRQPPGYRLQHLASVLFLLVLIWYLPDLPAVTRKKAPLMVPKSDTGKLPHSSTPVVESKTKPRSFAIADTGGILKEIQINYLFSNHEELKPVYNTLFPHLNPATKIQVLCPDADSSEDFVFYWGDQLTEKGHEVNIVSVDRDISIWARDRRIARADMFSNRMTDFIPFPHFDYTSDKLNELTLVRWLKSCGLSDGATYASMVLEGGNLVSDDRLVFTGYNTWWENQDRFSSPAEVEDQLFQLFGRPPLLLGAGLDSMPWGHVDMIVTPVGKKHVLMADADSAGNLMDTTAWLDETASDTEKDVLKKELEEWQLQIKTIRDQLIENGYKVTSIPCIPNIFEEWAVTYNNVIMENCRHTRRVFMPVYNLPALDNAATVIYRKLGYTVIPIDVSQVYRMGGTVRCLVNVIARYTDTHEPEFHFKSSALGTTRFYKVED